MPRVLAPELLACLDRENPRVDLRVELHAPDVARILRRPDDQLLLAPDPQVSLTPAASLVSAPSGGVALASTAGTLVSFLAGGSGPMNVDREDPSTRIKGVSWAVDPAFDRAVLRSFTARLHRSASIFALAPAFELQVYRAAGRWGVITKPDGTQRVSFDWEFIPMLAAPALVRAAQVPWVGDVADVVFDLTGQNLVIDGSQEQLPSAQNNGRANYYFSVRQVGSAASGTVTWQADAVSARSVAGVGDFDQSWWSRTRVGDAWAQQLFGQVPQCSIQVEQYNPAGGYAEAVYKIDLGRVPSAGTEGRIRFERSVPLGCAATAELSTAGSGGPFVPVLDGDVVAVAQQLYHLRVRLTPSASHRATPILAAAGIEFRTPYDVSRERILEELASDVAVPYCAATVGDGSLSVLRTGRRDFGDTATLLGSTKPATTLEVDVFLNASHPRVTRDKWLRLMRGTVVDRIPSETSEKFLLLSYLSMLQREIPLPVETINSVYTVLGAPSPTPLQVYVTPALQGATPGGTEYSGKGYFMRVRKSAQPGVAPGTVAVISSHTNAVALNFGAGVLNGTLAAGDEIEVHSGVLDAPVLTYKDEDPADVWWDVLAKLQIPPERIGAGHLPRGGLPPKVTDRAPGDAATQAKCKVSLALEKAEKGDKLLDEVSFIMGGATVEIAGQICFVQIYPLRDGSGNISVPLPAASRAIGPRDYFDTNFPQGIAARLSAVTCQYGVDTTVPTALRLAASQVEVADSDAINWLTLSPNDNRGRTAIPDEIARWCFNSSDQGLYLAAELDHQVVVFFSTGMRVWEWSERNAHPENHTGDVIALTTDRYTDYDPSGNVPIAGWKTVNVVLLGVKNGGRHFRGIVPGINPQVVKSIGQGGGVIAGGTNSPVDAPGITITHKATNLSFVPTPVLLVTFTPPSDPNFAGVALEVETDGDATTIANIAPSAASPIRIPATWDTTYRITPIGVTQSGVRARGAQQSYTTPNSNSWRRDIVLMKSDGSGAADGTTAKAIDANGTQLPSEISVQNPAALASPVRITRNGQEGTCRHNVQVVYPVLFDGTPMSDLRGGVGVEPGNMWGTATQVDSNSPSGATTGYGAKLAGVREYHEYVALNAGPGSFLPRLRMRQKAVATPQAYDFSGTAAVALGGTDASAALAAGAAANDQYRIRGLFNMTARAGLGLTVDLRVTIRIVAVIGGVPFERWRGSWELYDDTGVTQTLTVPLDMTLAQSGMGTSDFWRFEIIDVTKTGTGTTTQSLRGRKNSIDGYHGVDYNTSSGDKFASKTPDVDDTCIWQSVAVA